MPCYHPMIRIEDRSKWEVSKDGHKYHPAKIYNQMEVPNDLETLKRFTAGHYKQTTIPCGKCIGCRLDYSREWANRGYLESLNYENNWFVTITYDEDHLPQPTELIDKDGITWWDEGNWEGGTLVPEHLTQFIKNVRQIMKRDYNENGIRFMAAGEYGDKGQRPHYHIIFFNLNLPVDDLYNPRIHNGNIYYQSHVIERAWNKGISNLSQATWNTIAYTARYITKKINGEGSEELYYSNGKIKEFFRVSRMPGIGQEYFQKNWEKIYKTDSITVKNTNGIIKSRPPTYFDKLLKEEHPEIWIDIQRKRQEEEEKQRKLKTENTSLFLRENLKIQERTKENNNLSLRRTLEKKGIGK